MKASSCLLLLLCLTTATQAQETNATRKFCSRNEACRLVEKIPLVIDIGSGEGIESSDSSFPYEAVSIATESHDLCDCPDDSECPAADDSTSPQAMKLDDFFAIRTCRPLAELLRPCRNFLHPMIRVFKQLNGTQTDLSFVQAKVYCHCHTGQFERGRIIEPWNDGSKEAITFFCLRAGRRI